MKSDQSRFIVDTKNGALDISNEAKRTYYFSHSEPVVVKRPKFLWVKASSDPALAGQHSHRIETKAGTGIYIRAGWLAIEWELTDPLEAPVSF